MQTLETTQIIAPEGYFVSNVKLTAAGRAKFEESFEYWYRGGYVNDTTERGDESTWEYANVSADEFIYDIECDATAMEMAPACRIGNEEIHFVRDVDYVVEMQSFEADSLARLARNLNDLHDTMQAEMTRLGW
jgi:hypothetical protein